MYKRGFTLIELLVVVMVVGVLTAIAMPQYRRSLDRAKATEAMQLLPAIFEVRERWMIEHGCKWTNGEVATGCSGTLNFNKLDLESKGEISNDKMALVTPNFTYFLVSSVGAKGQPCVAAEPVWGSKRGLAMGDGNSTPLTIYYRGDKFSCSDGSIAGGCDILNVTPEAPAENPTKYRTGCI